MWWDGAKWADAATVEAADRRRGKLLLEITRKGPFPTLRIHENEVWKVMPAGVAGSLGGAIGGARAEILAQNQFNATSVMSNRNFDLAAATVLHLWAPTYEFWFELLRKEMNPRTRNQLAWAVEFINNRSRDLGGETKTPTKESEGFSVADELAKFAALRDQGVLTDDEFNAKKAQLLA